MELHLTDKIAVITGASRGIGRAIALELGKSGCRVMLAARDRDALAGLAAEIEALGGKAAVHAGDLRRPEAPGLLAKATLEAFGGLDIVVNNAGATKRGDFLALTDADFEDGFALKYYAAMRLARAAWPALQAARGSVVNIVGVGGRTPGAEFAVGGSVNGALLSLTKALAELGLHDGVQVNAVNPGPVATGRLVTRIAAAAKDQGVSADEASEAMVASLGVTRIGRPEDIAALVAFVVSARGRWLHGSIIDMDGGQTKTL